MKRFSKWSVACLAVIVGVLTVGGFAFPGAAANAVDQPDPNRVANFMKVKLQHAERVLEAISLADFDLLAKESQAMSLLTQEEQFQVLVTPDYLRHSVDFRRSADALTKAARDKNIDAAALAYVDMTMKCVNCHKYVRDVRMASVPAELFNRLY